MLEMITRGLITIHGTTCQYNNTRMIEKLKIQKVSRD